jgi:hypothetical protein
LQEITYGAKAVNGVPATPQLIATTFLPLKALLTVALVTAEAPLKFVTLILEKSTEVGATLSSTGTVIVVTALLVASV